MSDSENFHTGSNERTVAKYTMSVAVMMTGVAAHKIRKFEEFGLCKPFRKGSRQRLFSDCDIELIQEIAALERRGINLPGIKTILEMKHSGNFNSITQNSVQQTHLPSADSQTTIPASQIVQIETMRQKRW